MNKVLLVSLLGLSFVSNAEDSIYACRDSGQKHKFDKEQGYPKGRKGYVVDHICPLKWGGLDDSINMQYQNIKEGHIKDKIEATEEGKVLYCNESNSTPNRLVYNCKSSESALEAKDRVENKEESDE